MVVRAHRLRLALQGFQRGGVVRVPQRALRRPHGRGDACLPGRLGSATHGAENSQILGSVEAVIMNFEITADQQQSAMGTAGLPRTHVHRRN